MPIDVGHSGSSGQTSQSGLWRGPAFSRANRARQWNKQTTEKVMHRMQHALDWALKMTF